MSVPTWKRKQSDVQFLAKLFELNMECARIVNNKPKKYKQNYGDFLIKSCLEALQYAQCANSVYPSKATPDYLMEYRRLNFEKSKAILDNIPTTAYIFLELVRNSDGNNAKIYREEAYFGEICGEIQSLISGVIKSDSRWR